MQAILKYDNAIPCTNIMAVIEDFVVSKEINYVCMTSSQNRFILSNLSIVINLSKCKKTLCFLCKDKKAPHSSFYEDELLQLKDLRVGQ